MFDQKVFIEALRFVSHCASIKDVRYYLNGVRFELTPTSLTMIATNGSSMAMVEIVGDYGSATGAFTVKRSDIKFILNAIKPDKGRVSIVLAGDFTIQSTTTQPLKFEALDGVYPDWRRVMPRGEPVATPTIDIATNLLADSAKAANRLTDKYGRCKVEMRGATNSVWLEPVINPDFAAAGLIRAGVVISPMRR